MQQSTEFKPIPLSLPPCTLQISKKEGNHLVFDILRKKHLICTPEEWVRQHWIHYLIEEKHYPKALIMPESGLQLNNMPRRSDLLVYSRKGSRLLLAEFKNPGIRITDTVFEQIARYNSVFKVPYLLVSNGLTHFYCKIDFNAKKYTFLPDLPVYNELISE